MNLIRLVGLGPGATWQVPERNIEALKGARKVFLRTSIHPSVPLLDERAVRYETFDRLYERCSTFEEVYQGICDTLLDEASQGGVIAYAVPGHPLFGEATVRMVIRGAKERGIHYEVLPAMSFLDAVCSVLEIDPLDGIEIADACVIAEHPPTGSRGVIVCQVYDQKTASDAKLALMTRFPDQHMVALVTAAGVPGGDRVTWVPLYEIDRRPVDHLTTLFVPGGRGREGEGLEDAPAGAGVQTPGRPSVWPLDAIVNVIARLRGENGCPWDREQTHRSLRPYVLEEAYEVVEAIDQGDMNKLCDELGDLLLQVVLHSRIAQENGDFDVNRVVDGITKKMIRRHVHVFGGPKAWTSDEVIDRWDAIKRRERGEPSGQAVRAFEGLPALMRAYEVQKAASKTGFDWKDVRGVLAKVREELDEFSEALESRAAGRIEDEAGDILFSVVNLCRFTGVNPEVALTHTIAKFLSRFGHIEAAAARMGKDLSEMSLEEMDELWEESKG
ncbi:MAG: nucleoside triphosphate pyrophosphohydrolase [Ignavibacteriales bacterium]